MSRVRTMPRLAAGKYFYDESWWIHYPCGSRQKAELRNCEFCGEEFVVASRLIGRQAPKSGNFCSKEHSNLFHAPLRLGQRKKNGAPPGSVKPHSLGKYLLERVAANDPFLGMSIAMTDKGKFPNGWVFQHRLVMARALGRSLTKTETVHHINGNRQDNRVENLQLRSGSHGRGQVACCGDCGSSRIIFKAV